MAPNDDMIPRISTGDVLLYYRLGTKVSTQDIIIAEKTDKNGIKTDYIGRVVALGGDVVNITEKGGLIINGNSVEEENIYYETQKYNDYQKYPIKLKADECFILSDRRDGGEDSRYFGPVKESEIQGTVIGQFRKNGI